jgi:acetyl-CoA C-acetyltransferase/acetyl-CoA acyltransferase
VTVHRNCASGFESITTAYERMIAGRGSLFLVGGVDSMSRVPLLYQQATAEKFAAVSRAKSTGQKLSALAAFRPADFEPRVGLKLGLSDPVCGLNMGQTAEILARENGISRGAQDAFALESHNRALEGRDKLAEEITPVYLPNKGGQAIIHDNGPRQGQSLDKLAKLQPVFDPFGSVTAGNSSQITDGAVALLVGTEDRARQLGREPLGILTDYAYAGCDPARMGLGPVFAFSKLEREYGRNILDADIIEINEAFAAQVLACLAQLRLEEREISPQRLNLLGGAIALGHPVGATGSRLVLSALMQLRRLGKRSAAVSACVGGGQGGALWLETVSINQPSTVQSIEAGAQTPA